MGLRSHLRVRRDQRELSLVRKPIIVKIGGSALAGGALDDLPEILASEIPVALVHGGGQQLTRMLDTLGLPTEFREGLRVTDEATMAVAGKGFGRGGDKGPL